MLNDKQIERVIIKLKTYESNLENKIFKKIDKLNVDYFETEEDLYTVPPKDNFKKLPTSFKWGWEKSKCWFKGTYKVDENLNGEDIFIMPKVGGYEILMYINNEPFGNFTTDLVDTEHGNHYCNMIKKDAKVGDVIDIALECYAGHYVIGTQPFEVSKKNCFTYDYNDIFICTKDKIVSEVYFNLKILIQLALNLNDIEYKKAAVIKCLLEVNKIANLSIDSLNEEYFHKNLRDVNEILKTELTDMLCTTRGYAGLIGHSHMDTAWLWDVKETIKKCARTFSNQLNLMERYHDYKFIQSSIYHLEMIRENYPSLFKKIKEKVKEGKYEINGGAWVECDCNIVSGESLIRQFLWGQKYLKKHFGIQSNVFWLPDTFGYSASIPQILKGCGIDYFLTTKIAWNDTNVFPYDTFYWKGLDGSKVLTHFNRTHVWPDPKTLIEDTKQNNLNSIKQKLVTNKKLLAYGHGDGGGGPQFEMIEIANRLKNIESLPKTEHIYVGKFMKELEQSLHDPNTYWGELYLELHRGTLTNQHVIKRNNRKAEIGLRNLEYLITLDSFAKDKIIENNKIKPILEKILVNQFHDILPGTCIPSAHDIAKKEMAEVLKGIEEEESKLFSFDNNYYTLINSLSFSRDDVHYIKFNNKVPKNLYYDIFKDIENNLILCFKTPLRGFETKVIELEAKEYVESTTFNEVSKDIETDFLKISLDENNFIKSLYDKEAKRELSSGKLPLNAFIIADDVPCAWDSWDVDADVDYKFKKTITLKSSHVVLDNNIEIRIRSTYKISDKSSILQDMIIYKDKKEIKFDTIVDWQEEHKFMKTSFDTTILSDFSRQEIQFGHIKRPTTRNNGEEQAKFEVCNHKFCDLSELEYGVSLLNDCKYGVSVKNSNISLSLHKGGMRPDYRGDKGRHKLSYSLVLHNGFNFNNVIKNGYIFNYPVISHFSKKQYGQLLTVEKESIIVETIKPMEDVEKSFIIRIYESTGTYSRTKINFNNKIKKIYETDMLENELKELSMDEELIFNAFEIKTIKATY